MPTILGAFRSMLMTPSLASVSFEGRKFPVTATEATRRLEAIPQAVVAGFDWGIGARDLWEAERLLSMVEPELRGFAYEGTTMAFTIRDAMAGGRGKLTRDLLSGSGRPHIFLTYIGIGFAMARLPRPLWKKIVPQMTDVPYHPTMSWLAVDGLGFDRAYFDTERWVTRQKRTDPYPWDGRPDYFPRAFDQGIGRALWFIHGAQALKAAAAVERFAPDRHADLWSGLGLAATFAGGCGPEDLADLRRASGEHYQHLAQGCVFAAKARDHSGHVPSWTEVATAVLIDMSVETASAMADEVATGGLHGDGQPPYEVWRGLIRDQFAPARAVR